MPDKSALCERALVSKTNPPQGHPITTLRALRGFNHIPNMALRHQCVARKGAGLAGPRLTELCTRHGSNHHPFITLRGSCCSSKLPIHSYRNAAKMLSSLRPAEGPPQKLSCGLSPDPAEYFVETNIRLA